MRPIIIAYVPPPRIVGAVQFLENIRSFKTKNTLLLYSDHDYDDMVKIRDPEQMRNPANRWSINNAIWITAIRIAKKVAGAATHMIYVEADSRVGADYWDQTIADQFYCGNTEQLIGGSAICFNPCNYDMEWTKRWSDYVAHHNAWRRNFPVPTYGFGGAAAKKDPCVFVNGSLGIYDLSWIYRTFNIGNASTLNMIQNMPAWDYLIGVQLFEEFKHEAWNKVKHLSRIYSSYGDVLTSETERRNMLTDGTVVAVHQIKSDWPGPRRNDRYGRDTMEQGKAGEPPVGSGDQGSASGNKTDSQASQHPLPGLDAEDSARPEIQP